MFRMLFGLIFFGIYIVNIDCTVPDYISQSDIHRLKTVLVKSLIFNENDDFSSSYYAAKAFKLLDEPLVEVLKMDNCAYLKREYNENVGAEVKFQALSAWNLLHCKGALHTETTIQNLQKLIDSDKIPLSDLRYTLETLKHLNQSILNPTKVAQLIQTKLKENENLLNLGHALHAAAILGNAGKFITGRFEDILIQVDEIDGKLFLFEGGLSVTSQILTGLLRIPNAKPLAVDQAEKFANYLLSRRTVQTPKGALALLEAAKAIVASDVSPVCITLVGSPQISVENPELRVRVSDLFGGLLRKIPVPVVAQSATRVADDVVVLSKQPLTPSTDPVQFSLILKLEPGQYRLVISADVYSITINIRLTGPVNLEWLEIGLTDTDGTSAPRLVKLTYPEKLQNDLQADSSQRLIVKFALSRKLHQTFLRLFSDSKDIIFVAETDNSKYYKIDVNLGTELTYTDTLNIELILGDTLMSNPIRWVIGRLDVTMPSVKPKSDKIYGPKPEIVHLFRPAEKRPPQALSLFFTALTASPLLLLLILWLKIGINFNNFTPVAIPFHLGLAAILGLFTLFFLKFDMFTTCAWLIPIGSFTFLAGHRLLSRIAKKV